MRILGRVRKALCLASVAGALSAQPNMGTNKITVVPSPSPTIGFAQFTPEAFPRFQALSDARVIASGAFIVLTNSDSRAINAATVLWNVVDSAGKEHKFTTTCDSFLSRDAGPVVTPGSKILIGPQTCVSEESSRHYNLAGNLGVQGSRPGLMQQLGSATGAEVSLDSIVFVDGELVGPDNRHKGTEVVARAAAARSVGQSVRRTMAQGGDVAEVLAHIISTTADPPLDREAPMATFLAFQQAQWTRTFAQRLATSKHLDADTRHLENRPPPPVLFRAGH